MKRFFNWKVIAILIVTLFLGFFDLPADSQKALVPFTPESITSSRIYLGLDLQGGSQLDYKIDLRKVPEADHEDIVEGVQSVIEKRVNGLGVSEPNIFRSEIAGETHIIVELAETAVISQEDVDSYLGVGKLVAQLSDDEKKKVSLEKAKATVGKTIQLEFKEQKATLDENEEAQITEKAQAALDRINNGEQFSVIGQEEQQAYAGKVTYQLVDFDFIDSLGTAEKEALTKLKSGEHSSELIKTGGGFTLDPSTGAFIENTGLGIFNLIETKEELKNAIEVDTSHILISYKGAEGAGASVTRTQDEAKELAASIKDKLDAEESFDTLAKENSDDESNKDNGGKLDAPVTGDGTYAFEYEEASMAFTKVGQISEPVESQFGYHIIKADGIRENVTGTQYKYESIVYSTVPDPWQDTGLNGEHFVHAAVELDQFLQPYVRVQFDEEGSTLFQDLTAANVSKPIAIFVGGELISSPTVQQEIAGGVAIISGSFTDEEARILARDLNTGAIPAPIILTGEYTVGATLGHAALTDSLRAGAIGLLIVMLFMLFYYRLAGLMANIALLTYASILLFLIKAQINIGVALVISLIIFGYVISKTINSKDSGWEKFLSFMLSCFAFFFVTFLLKTGVVMTLAGVAGIIMSIGIAVDANILIFERLKEELREGKPYNNAVNSAFTRAWSAIRDSNFSTLITCAILFYFGSSIIKGFAFNLAAGTLVSMFTAIVVTRALLLGLSGSRASKPEILLGVKEGQVVKNEIQFIKNGKIWLGFSSVLIVLSILSVSIFGLNLGIDFKGGTLMEIQFKESVSNNQIASALEETQKVLESSTNVETDVPAIVPASEEIATETLSAAEDTLIDLSNAKIQESNDNNYIIKTKYLSSTSHEKVIEELQKHLPEFNEARFTAIGPVIGSTLLQKSIVAMLIALVLIILYIAIAFRKIPKELSAWKFGLSAIAALAHDMIIVTGIFAVLGAVLNVEIDALFITAMLTVFGYSVNDTIVVFDRLRENLNTSGDSFGKIADKSLNQTLARSINTSLSTIITLAAILIFGSPSIFYFVLALTIGITVGTYSSILIASPLLVYWTGKSK